jgi:hypothetical protein
MVRSEQRIAVCHDARMSDHRQSRSCIIDRHAFARVRADAPTHGHSPEPTALRRFRLSKGVINLDTQWNAPWDRVTSFLRAGKWAELAIWRQVLVDHGHGGGNRFGKGHAILYGFDQDSGLFVAIDPLVAHPQPIPESVMREAAAEMLTRAGVGAPAGAYVAFTRDVFDEAGNVARRSTRCDSGRAASSRTASIPGTLKIQGRVARRFSHETSAPADPPRTSHGQARATAASRGSRRACSQGCTCSRVRQRDVGGVAVTDDPRFEQGDPEEAEAHEPEADPDGPKNDPVEED